MAGNVDLPNIKAFKETVSKFTRDFKLVEDTSNVSELGELELKLINELQLLEVQVAMMGRDVYDSIQERRISFTTGSAPLKKTEKK